MVICLERGADLHIAQLMPLPLTVSCSSKIQIGFTFLVPAYPGCPGKEAVLNGCYNNSISASKVMTLWCYRNMFINIIIIIIKLTLPCCPHQF